MVKQIWNSFLFRERSVARVLRDSFAVIKKNNLRMFLQLWPALLLVVVMGGGALFFSSTLLLSVPFVAVLFAFFLLAYFVWKGAVFSFFRNYNSKNGVQVVKVKINYKEWGFLGLRNLLISLPLMILTVGFIYLGIILFDCNTLFSQSVVLFFVGLLVCVPFALIEYQFMIGKDNYLNAWKKGLYYSYKYWGTTFLVLFISGLIYVVISLIVLLPMGILQVAIVDAAQHVAMGDQVDLPSWAPMGFIVLSFVSLFFVVLLDLIRLFPLLFQYSNIRKRETMK